jgi:hypothetical protein
MKVISRTALCLLVFFFGFWRGALLAQVSDHENNLSACKNASESCNRSESNRRKYCESSRDQAKAISYRSSICR